MKNHCQFPTSSQPEDPPVRHPGASTTNHPLPIARAVPGTGPLAGPIPAHPFPTWRRLGSALVLIGFITLGWVVADPIRTEAPLTEAQTGLTPETAGSLLAPLVGAVVGRFGGAVQALTVMALLRTLFKPVMSAVETAVRDHPAQASRLARFERSWVYRALAFTLDLATSIKLHLVTPPPSTRSIQSSATQVQP